MRNPHFILFWLCLLASLPACNFYKGDHFYGGEPAISSDGNVMVFAGIEANQRSATDGNIYAIDFRSGKLRRLTDEDDQTESSPSFSSDGKKIVYTSNDSKRHFIIFVETNVAGIWTRDSDGGNAKQLTDIGGSLLSFSPSGDKIVFCRYFSLKPEGASRCWHVFNMNCDGSDVKQLTFSLWDGWIPVGYLEESGIVVLGARGNSRDKDRISFSILDETGEVKERFAIPIQDWVPGPWGRWSMTSDTIALQSGWHTVSLFNVKSRHLQVVNLFPPVRHSKIGVPPLISRPVLSPNKEDLIFLVEEKEYYKANGLGTYWRYNIRENAYYPIARNYGLGQRK